jgi:hypothetical protein
LIPTDRLGIACSSLRDPPAPAAVKLALAGAARNGLQHGMLESNAAAMKDRRR